MCRNRRAADVVLPLEQPYPQPGPRQVRRGDQAVVASADHDDVESCVACVCHRSAGVALDLVGRAHPGLTWVATRLAQSAALAQQIPALVELGLERAEPLVFLGLADLVVLEFGAQVLLLGDEFVDVCQGVALGGITVWCHESSVPHRATPVGLLHELVARLTSLPMTTKPEIDFPDGPAPDELLIEDLVVGDGAEAVPGGTVKVHYVGVEYDTGEEFDSSWNRGQSIEFPLRGLIQGWQDGIPGMRVGGRRKLVIPPAQAYGPAGSGHRFPGKH